MASFDIQVLRPTHDRKSFSCGTPVLDRYLAELATQDIKRRVSNCFVAVDENGAIAGYYTFAATSIPLVELQPEQCKQLPRYPLVPAALVGRLAVDTRFRGLHLGGALIADALQRCGRAEAAVYALVVDAKDEQASNFYAHLGFLKCVSRPMSLYLPVKTSSPRSGA